MNPFIEELTRLNGAQMTCVAIDDSRAVETYLVDHGYTVFSCDLEGLTSKYEIFQRLTECLFEHGYPTNNYGAINLATFDDLFIDVLAANEKIAVLIHNSEYFVAHFLNLLFQILLVFKKQIIRSLQNGKSKTVHTFLIGQGPNFDRDFVSPVASSVTLKTHRSKNESQE
jgi:hypothetical protein